MCGVVKYTFISHRISHNDNMGIVNTHINNFLGLHAFSRNPQDNADIARELAGSNLINRTVSRYIPQDSPIQGLFSLQQWGFVGGMQLLGDIAGYAGRSLLAPYGLGLVGQIVFDEVATGIFTGALRGRENIGTHIGRDIGEGLATRLIILPISLLLGGSPLARFVLQPILFGAVSYFVQRAGDLAFHEQTAPTSFTDHLLSSGVMMLQGHSLMLGRYRARQIHEEHGVFNWISWKIWPPVISPRWDSQGDYCYHGTSIHELSNIIFSGGSMKRDITFFCNEPSFSFGYARARARRSLTHGIVLQFDQTMISDRLKP